MVRISDLSDLLDAVQSQPFLPRYLAAFLEQVPDDLVADGSHSDLLEFQHQPAGGLQGSFRLLPQRPNAPLSPSRTQSQEQIATRPPAAFDFDPPLGNPAGKAKQGISQYLGRDMIVSK